MNRIRPHLGRQMLAALLAIVLFSPRAQSQAAHAPPCGPTLDAARVGLSMPARTNAVPARTDGPASNRAANVVVGAAAGAAAGWLLFSVSVGALASDHGAPYKRARRRWMIDGAVIGAVLGAFSPPPPHFSTS